MIFLPANAPTVIAAPIDPSGVPPPDGPHASGGFDPVGPPMIAVPASPVTQVSLVPPMPDTDLPIGPPTAIISSEGSPGSQGAGGENLFPRPETPLAPPPSPSGAAPRSQREGQPPRPRGESRPPPPPRHRRESQSPPRAQPNGPQPRAHRDSQLPPPPTDALAPHSLEGPPPAALLDRAHESRESPSAREGQSNAPARDGQTAPPPRAMRASVPMPARPGRPAPSPSQPPPPPGSPRVPPPRSTISMSVPPPPGGSAVPAIPPIPAIPAIPPIPGIPKRAAPDAAPATSDAGDVDQATLSRVPIEITDNASPTSVNYDLPEEVAAAAQDSADTQSGTGESIEAPTHMRATVPFTVPDTSPTEPVETFEARRGAATDPNGEAVTVPARSREPSPSTPPRDRMPKLPISTAPDSLPPPKDSKQQASGPSPACPQCESPMAWVEEHLRFYCKSCRMYF